MAEPETAQVHVVQSGDTVLICLWDAASTEEIDSLLSTIRERGAFEGVMFGILTDVTGVVIEHA